MNFTNDAVVKTCDNLDNSPHFSHKKEFLIRIILYFKILMINMILERCSINVAFLKSMSDWRYLNNDSAKKSQH